MLTALLLALLTTSTAVADTSATPTPTHELRTRIVDPVPLVPDLPSSVRLDAETTQNGAFTTTGEALQALPAVHGVRRGAGQIEPVIRGLGSERVRTQVGPLPLFGACPGRMDPPVNMLPLLAADEMTVVEGLAPVALGTAGTGGRIVLDDELRRFTAPDLGGWLRGGFDGARNATVGELRVDRRIEGVDTRVALEAVDAGDTEDARGNTVPSEQEALHGVLSLAGDPDERTRLWMNLNVGTEGRTLFPALPMDMRRSDIGMLTSGVRRAVGDDTNWELRVGGSRVDHSMDNQLKSNRAMMEANTESEASSLAARATWTTRWSDHDVQLGLDATTMSRDARRRRTVFALDRTFDEHLWPELSQSAVGVFGQWERRVAAGHDLRVGARVNHVQSHADATDDPLGAGTIADAYVRFHGDEARRTDDDRFVASGNIQWQWRVDRRTSLHAGTGITQRAPGVHESWIAFAPAPGGFRVGNPTLDTETGWENEIGVRWDSRALSIAVTAYHTEFRDFVLETTVAREDVNGDGRVDRVRGFENVDARRTGVELTATARPWRWLALPLSLHAVRAHDTTHDLPLPQTPPVEARFGTRVIGARGLFAPWSAQLTARAVAEQDRVDPRFGEDRTPGFVTLDLDVDLSPSPALVLRAGVRNLLDHAYHEHLTREAVLPTQDLAAGDEVGAPGRAVHLSLGWRY